jgi:hypothetical protein
MLGMPGRIWVGSCCLRNSQPNVIRSLEQNVWVEEDSRSQGSYLLVVMTDRTPRHRKVRMAGNGLEQQSVTSQNRQCGNQVLQQRFRLASHVLLRYNLQDDRLTWVSSS